MSNLALFLHLDGLPGTVTLPNYVGQITLLSVSLGATNAIQHPAGGGALISKPNFSNVEFIKAPDIASVSLFSHLCSGLAIANGTLSVLSVSPTNVTTLLYKYEFTGINITSFNSSGGTSGGDNPAVESVYFSFNTIAVTWNIASTPAIPNPISPSTGWNLVTNTHT